MIENAKIKSVINQANGLMAAVFAYQDKYGYLPGDDPYATTHSGFSGTTNGNGDGDLGDNVNGSYEYYKAPQHLALAGFITGTYNGTDETLQHKFGGRVFITRSGIGVTLPTTNMIRFDNLPGKVAEVVDNTLDDGVWDTGNVRANEAYTNDTVDYVGVGL
jgi:hypothetical protein